MEEKKQLLEERIKDKYEKDTSSLKKLLEEKTIALKHANNLVEKLEEEIKELKKKN